MIVAFDTNCLVKWSSKKEADRLARARLEHLAQQVANAGGRIIIPTPALAEFLVHIDEAAAAWLDTLDRKRHIIASPLDRRAAFECSLLDKAAINRGDKRGGRPDPWQRIKIDRQIVAIARVTNASCIVSDDAGLRGTATAAGLRALQIGDLDLPDSARQEHLPFDPAAAP